MDLGFRVQGLGFQIWGSWIWDAGFWIWDLNLGLQGFGLGFMRACLSPIMTEALVLKVAIQPGRDIGHIQMIRVGTLNPKL